MLSSSLFFCEGREKGDCGVCADEVLVFLRSRRGSLRLLLGLWWLIEGKRVGVGEGMERKGLFHILIGMI